MNELTKEEIKQNMYERTMLDLHSTLNTYKTLANTILIGTIVLFVVVVIHKI